MTGIHEYVPYTYMRPLPQSSTVTDSYPAELVALGDELTRLQQRRATVHPGARLENSAWRILRLLDDGEPRTLRVLATELELEQSTVNRQVNAAISAGMLERFEVTGRRSLLIRPTALGREAFDHDARIRAEPIQAAIDALGPEATAVLVEGLQALNDAWDRAISERSERG